MKYKGNINIHSFLKFLQKKRIQMVPCAIEEITQLKKIAGSRPLPSSYLAFMEKAGNGFHLFLGSDYAFKDIANLKEWAVELLQENSFSEMLLDSHFVFFMHQGYQFYFFDLNDGDNAPVYYYGEGENMNSFRKKNNTFTEFLIHYYNEVESLI